MINPQITNEDDVKSALESLIQDHERRLDDESMDFQNSVINDTLFKSTYALPPEMRNVDDALALQVNISNEEIESDKSIDDEEQQLKDRFDRENQDE